MIYVPCHCHAVTCWVSGREQVERRKGWRKRERGKFIKCVVCVFALNVFICLSSVETIYFITIIGIQDAHKALRVFRGVKYPYRQEMLPNLTEKCIPPPENRMLGRIDFLMSAISRPLLLLKLWNPGVCEHKVYAQLAFSTRHGPGFNKGSGRVTG